MEDKCRMNNKCLRFISALADVGVICVGGIILIIGAVLFFGSMLGTADLGLDEVITFGRDNIFLNILWLILCCAFGIGLMMLMKKKELYMRISSKQLYTAVGIITFIVGVLWILQSLSSPTNDSRITTEAGIKLANGDYSPIGTVYFKRFPFQLGYVFWTEICSRLLFLPDKTWGLVLQVVNIICLAFANVALVRISERLFKNKAVTFATAVMLILFSQSVIFSSFMYGTIPGFAFAVWAVYNFIAYIQDEKIKNLVLASILVTVAVWIKLNNLIFAVAMIIILVVHFLRGEYLKRFLSVCLMALIVFGAKNLPVIQYELRTGNDFGDGIPMVCWLSMGLGDSVFAPGWYDSRDTVALFDGPEDADYASNTAKERIKERIEFFKENPDKAYTFFKDKTYSQWNEPTFSSIWNNKVRGQYAPKVGYAKLVCGEGEEFTKNVMDINVQFLYFGFMISSVFMIFDKFKKKGIKDEFILIPTVIIGGFLYHLLFEAKSQYVLPYVVIMIPYCVWGTYRLTVYIRNLIKSR